MGGWIKAHWIPREQNEVADMLSKSNILSWELLLDMDVVQMLWQRWYTPVLDLFASADCHLLPAYCSFLPDSNTFCRDCLSLSQWPDRCYAFPPVPLISHPGDSQMAGFIMVDEASSNASRGSSSVTRIKNHSDISSGIKDPISQPSGCLSSDGQALLSQEAQSLLQSDISQGTHAV